MNCSRGFTVLVAARNAAATITRALASVREEADALLLIDDGSTDDTVALARQAGGRALRVIRRPHHGPLGATRQAALAHVDTPFAAWLDADDQYIPGRIQRLTSRLHSGADVAADATILLDGLTGAVLAEARLPEWSTHDGGPVRLFERNALPAVGLVGFRTGRWRELKYDPTLHGAEDTDIVLRAVSAGCRFGWVSEPGTRVHVYASSLSRHRDNQRSMYARALRKHRYDDVRGLYETAGWGSSVTTWALASMAMFREEFGAVLHFLEEVAQAEGVTWRVTFLRGTALLMMGHPRAIEVLHAAETLEPTPEAANNLGIALARNGRSDEAHRAFASSLERFADYQDARINLESVWPSRITTHPLRNRT
jgi:glycosyltransferase involved in cell wall biosynthesis